MFFKVKLTTWEQDVRGENVAANLIFERCHQGKVPIFKSWKISNNNPYLSCPKVFLIELYSTLAVFHIVFLLFGVLFYRTASESLYNFFLVQFWNKMDLRLKKKKIKNLIIQQVITPTPPPSKIAIVFSVCFPVRSKNKHNGPWNLTIWCYKYLVLCHLNWSNTSPGFRKRGGKKVFHLTTQKIIRI